VSKEKVILNTHSRPVNMVMSSEDLERLHDLVDVVWGKDEAMPEEEIAKVRGDVYGIITGRTNYGSLEDMPNLKVIMETNGRHHSSKALDYKACFERGIRVLSCAPAYGPMVAEMALGLVIASAREFVDAHQAFQEGEEVYLYPSNQTAFTLYDQPVGFIGFGGLARNLKSLLAPFRCPIQVYDPWLPDTQIRKGGGIPADLETVLKTSKVIFMLAIPSNENKAMLDRELLSLIQKDSIFALISRSHAVDFDALTDLLHKERFRAVIDVFPQEPLPKDHRIRTAPNTILSPHRAGSVKEDLHLIGKMVVDDLEAMLAGLPPSEMQVAQPEIVYRLP